MSITLAPPRDNNAPADQGNGGKEGYSATENIVPQYEYLKESEIDNNVQNGKNKPRPYGLPELINSAMLLATVVIAAAAWYQAGKISDQTNAILQQDASISRQADDADLQLGQGRDFATDQDSFQRHTLDSTGRQIAIARETMEKSLRAYVFVKPDSAKLPKDIMFRLDMINSGQTPASEIFDSPYLFAANPKDTLLKTFHHFKLPRKSYLSLFRDAYFQADIRFSDVRVKYPKSFISAFNKGDAVIYVGGTVHYKDVFGNSHHTDYLFVTIPGNGPALREYEDGNDFN